MVYEIRPWREYATTWYAVFDWRGRYLDKVGRFGKRSMAESAIAELCAKHRIYRATVDGLGSKDVSAISQQQAYELVLDELESMGYNDPEINISEG